MVDTKDNEVNKEGETPEGETPEGETPEGETPEGETPEGEIPKSTTEIIELGEDFGVTEEAPEELRFIAPEIRERAPPVVEKTRQMIAFILVFGLLALFLASFLFAGTVDEAIKLIQAISSALTGLIGAVLGYYFGAISTEKKSGESPQ